MIEYYDKPLTTEQGLSTLNIFIRKWFEKRYKELTPPQKYSLKLIKQRSNVLITAPTGSGKTFSAFMMILSDLMDLALKGELEEKVYCVYVSPLRALNNDIYRNLIGPIEEIYSGISMDIRKISIGIRTGDTPAKDRQKMLVHPPNILVTTPESLAILVNSPKFMENMKDARYLIIDELHELANNKRGVHLSLSVERLAEIIGHDFIRIGLGATLAPLDEAARFLVGYKNASEERDCYIVDATWEKKMQFTAISPVKDIVNEEDGVIEGSIYKKINDIIKKNKTTLVFTNTRSGTERVVYNMMKRYKYTDEHIAAHHGSLSREIRLGVEEMLKNGKLKCAVCSTSLELGVDIGSIDEVVQLGSPKSVARAVQRIGRSGHSFGDTAIGDVIVTNRDDLVECSVMLDAAKKRNLDTFVTPKNALDILCQHIVGMSQTKKWAVDEAYELVRRAYPYHTLDKRDFISCVEYLAGKYVGLESRRVYGKIWHEESDGTFGRRGKLTKLIYYLNLGAIPDEVSVDVVTNENKWIGNIEEEFLTRLKPGDVFVLGGKPYRYEYSRVMRAYVTDATGQTPTIPPWFSEQLPLTYELAIQIGQFRKALSDAMTAQIKREKGVLGIFSKKRLVPNDEVSAILDKMPMDDNAKHSTFAYFAEQLLYAGAVPNDKLMLIEATEDTREEKNYVIFHSLYGRRINDALSRILAIYLGDRYETEIGININDNGFVIVTEGKLKIKGKDISSFLSEMANVDILKMLKLNIRRTEMMKRRFRYNAARSFMVLRNYRGVKISVRRQHVSSQILLKAAEELNPDFPVIKETYREIFEDVMDLPRAEMILKKMISGEIAYKMIETEVPSPFSHNMITFGTADIVMMKNKRQHIRELHKQVMSRISGMAIDGA